MDRGLLMGRFRLGERIGSGGMGVVYRAFDERLLREVAVKEIPNGDPERVLREAQAAARLNHPAIATVYELGRRGGSALLISELIPGAPLADLRARGAISDRDAAEVGIDVCEGLAHAHAAGVVHRDVKPQNVMVCEDHAPRRAKLMDFGIARLAGTPTLTATGEVVGTLAYMAPEQSEGLEAGPPADVYSLALTLYECWAGHNPVAAATPAATARRIGSPIASLAQSRPDLDPDLIAVIDSCLAVDPDQRPQAADLRAALSAARTALDPDRPVPSASDPDARRPVRPTFGLARVAAVVTIAGVLALIWGPLGAPGIALVLAALVTPAIVVLPGLGPAVPALAGVLAAAGAAGAYPAAAAHAGRSTGQRAVAGALGWSWALAIAITLGLGPTLATAPRATAGWESSAAAAASDVLLPMLAPGALAGLGAFAAAAAILGWMLAARHIALAALGTLIWAAALVAALSVVTGGALGERPIVIALGGLAALAYEHRRRVRAVGFQPRAPERIVAASDHADRAPPASVGLGA